MNLKNIKYSIVKYKVGDWVVFWQEKKLFAVYFLSGGDLQKTLNEFRKCFGKYINEINFERDNYHKDLKQFKDFEKVFFGTELQKKVWNKLLKLKKGEIVKYSELAKMVGNPRAVRAVASAVAKNQIPILVPCHLVVRKNGDYGNYRWGKDLKTKILATEKN